MDKNLDIITYAVTLIIRAAIMATRYSRSIRKRSLERLAVIDADTKDEEILFLKDKVCQLEMQVGKHGSIAVTERAIKTLKYEWVFEDFPQFVLTSD